MKTSGYCCSRCGEFLRVLLAACACGMVPDSYVEQAKSLILSTDYEVGDTWRGRSPQDLAAAAEQIRRGTFVFDPLEVSEVAAFLEYREREIQSLEMLPFLAPMLAGLIWMVLMLFLRDIRTKVAITASAGVVCAGYVGSSGIGASPPPCPPPRKTGSARRFGFRTPGIGRDARTSAAIRPATPGGPS